MPRICDFTAIRDTNFTIRRGGDIDRTFDFTLHSSLAPENTSVLAFGVDTIGSVTNLKLRIEVNGRMAKEVTLSGNRIMSMHEIMGRDYLQVGSNEVRFRLVSGTGGLNLSDVVLWWQRDI